MSPIDLPKLHEQHPELDAVWKALSDLEVVLQKKQFLDLRLLGNRGIHPALLAAAAWVLKTSGNYDCFYRVADPIDHQLQDRNYASIDEIPQHFKDDLDRDFNRAQADIVPILIDKHGR